MNRKIAILADIHSNHLALESCLKEAERRMADAYFFLGDYLGELAYPERTLELLSRTADRFPCVFIRGNKEDYWISHRKGIGNWKAGTSGSGMLKYVYDRLTPEWIDAFEQMPIARKMEYPGFPAFIICHGSPWRANESLREQHVYIGERTKQLETGLTICGHFHTQTAYERNGRRVINPGAVGVPLESGGQTQFMMLYGEHGQWKPDFISLPYDREKAILEMDEEKLFEQAPCWYRLTRELLRGGRVTHAAALKKAHDAYMHETGADDWVSIPEKYWNLALSELNIP